MKKKQMGVLSFIFIPALIFSVGATLSVASAQTVALTSEMIQDAEHTATEDTPAPAVLLYQGKASIRVITNEGRVIYIDPYAGEGYDLPADLILVTHAHFDHNGVDRIESRNPGCQVITWREAIQNGQHQVFELGYVTVEAVEAGYNRWHDVGNCVGYVLTFSNGCSIYVTGDTSTTKQMPQLAKKKIDYAFFCCDGIYNMGLEEASQCAGLVEARYSIPYHMTTTVSGNSFDKNLAERFDAENRILVADGGTLLIQ